MAGQHTAVFTDDNFQSEVLDSNTPVLVDFWAEWCGPCQMMGPVIDQVAEEFKGKMKVGKMDVEKSPETSGKYGIMSIPAFKVFKNGEVVEEMVGAMSKEALKEKLEAHLS